MTIQEFDDLKIGDTCLVTRGKDKGKRCIVLYKAGHTIKYDHRIGIVVVKPEDYGNLFESSTVTYRYFKLFSSYRIEKRPYSDWRRACGNAGSFLLYLRGNSRGLYGGDSIMTYKQIEASRELRLWIGQVIVPAVTMAVALASIPEVRNTASRKLEELKWKFKSRSKG